MFYVGLSGRTRAHKSRLTVVTKQCFWKPDFCQWSHAIGSGRFRYYCLIYDEIVSLIRIRAMLQNDVHFYSWEHVGWLQQRKGIVENTMLKSMEESTRRCGLIYSSENNSASLHAVWAVSQLGTWTESWDNRLELLDLAELRCRCISPCCGWTWPADMTLLMGEDHHLRHGRMAKTGPPEGYSTAWRMRVMAWQSKASLGLPVSQLSNKSYHDEGGRRRHYWAPSSAAPSIEPIASCGWPGKPTRANQPLALVRGTRPSNPCGTECPFPPNRYLHVQGSQRRWKFAIARVACQMSWYSSSHLVLRGSTHYVASAHDPSTCYCFVLLSMSLSYIIPLCSIRPSTWFPSLPGAVVASSMAKEQDVGIVGGVTAHLSILMTMAAFLAIAMHNVIEIMFLIFALFKQRSGLYFWSFIIATSGIVPHAIGFVLKFFQVTTVDLLSSAIIGVGWACMVIGQSVVLYSRLHLVVQDKIRIRWVLYMIIFNGLVLGIPLFVLAMGANYKYSPRFLPGFLVYDKIQIVIISIQETIISLIYVYETVRLLGGHGTRAPVPLKKLLRHLILVNVIVLIFDITPLAVQFSGHYEIQTTYKTAVYSVKLKIEFSVLNRLVSIVKHKNLLSTRRTLGTNLTFSRWTGSKKADLDTGVMNNTATFTKMDELSSRDRCRKVSSVKTFQASVDHVGIINLEDDTQDLESGNSQLGVLEKATSSSTVVRVWWGAFKVVS